MSTFSRSMGRIGLKLQKHAPAISMTAGVIGLTATVVLSSRATLNAQEIIKGHKADVDATHEAYKLAEEVRAKDNKQSPAYAYDLEAYQKDQVVIWSRSAVSMLKLYGPSIVLGCLSIAAIVNGHKIQNNRIVGLSAAYQLAETTLQRYREKISDELGVDVEGELYNDALQRPTEEEEKKAEGMPEEAAREFLNAPVHHGRFFDYTTSSAWQSDRTTNLIFLRAMQNAMNDRLRGKGHVFLNEVYDALGIDRSSAGAIVGWVYTGDEGSNNYIDFGIGKDADGTTEAIIKENIDPASFHLDFNVDGIIYDQI